MKHKILFVHRHMPTAALNHLLDLLAPFSYLRRERSCLEKLGVEFNAYPSIYGTLLSLVDRGFLPCILPVLLIQESNVYGTRITGFNSRTVLAVRDNPRAAIVTLQNANITWLSHLSTSDYVCAQIKTEGSKLTLVSLYQDIANRRVDFPMEQFKSLGNNLLLAGDTNSHSTLWGSPSNNPRGMDGRNLL